MDEIAHLHRRANGNWGDSVHTYLGPDNDVTACDGQAYMCKHCGRVCIYFVALEAAAQTALERAYVGRWEASAEKITEAQAVAWALGAEAPSVWAQFLTRFSAFVAEKVAEKVAKQ